MPHKRVGSRESPILVSSSDDGGEDEVVYLGEHRHRYRHQQQRPSTSQDRPKKNRNKGYTMMLSMGYVPGQGLGRELEGEVEPLPVLPAASKRKRTESGVGFRSSQSPEPGPSIARGDLAGPSPDTKMHGVAEVAAAESELLPVLPATGKRKRTGSSVGYRSSRTPEPGLSNTSGNVVGSSPENKTKRSKRRHKQQRSVQLHSNSHASGSKETLNQLALVDDLPLMPENSENMWDGQSRGGHPMPHCPYHGTDPMCHCKEWSIHDEQSYFLPDMFAGPPLPPPTWLAGNGLLPLAATLMQHGLPLSPEMAYISPTMSGLPTHFLQNLGEHVPFPEPNLGMMDSTKLNVFSNTSSPSQFSAPSSHEMQTSLRRPKRVPSIGVPPDPDPQSDHGLYRMSPPPPDDPEAKKFTMPIPSCTLVMESMPRSCRTLSFVRHWAQSFGASSVVRVEMTSSGGTKKKGAKALIEFSSADVARRAWSSPRLNGDGKDQIRVWWYRIQGVGASAGVGELEEGEIGGEDEPSESTQPQLQPQPAPPIHVAQEPVVTSLPPARVFPGPLPPLPSKYQSKKEKKAEQKAREKELAEMMHKATAEKRRLAQMQAPEFAVPLVPTHTAFGLESLAVSRQSAPAPVPESNRSGSSEEVAQLLDESESMETEMEMESPVSPSAIVLAADGVQDRESGASSGLASPSVSRRSVDVADHNEASTRSGVMGPGVYGDPPLRPLAPVFVLRKDAGLPPKPTFEWKASTENGVRSVVPGVQIDLEPSFKIRVVDSSAAQTSPLVRSSTPSSMTKMGTPPSEPRAMANAPKGPTYNQRVQSTKGQEVVVVKKEDVGVVVKDAASPTARHTLPAKPEPSPDTGDLSKEEALRRLVLASRKAKPTASESDILSGAEKLPGPKTLETSKPKPPAIEMPNIPVSKSLDDLAISFITETLQTMQSPSTDGPATVGNSPHEEAAQRPKAEERQEKLALVQRQRRLEEHLAATKVLMGRLERAGTRQEKDGVLRLIRERNRVYEEAEKQELRRARSVVWPETSRDAGILVISDDEDEDGEE
ncbi:hypothetical protein OE88DRAFT_1809906 [Heliocybe sulcata]|uniref:G-patch domain-containing protein n=1 Tax=Heliocybe sulcata TaxID=5364 RepID=A0A5C3MZ25_9AGAM|nr:hypothetical protein OE88DRAFT_1809906 [Heliocybe sulcata]